MPSLQLANERLFPNEYRGKLSGICRHRWNGAMDILNLIGRDSPIFEGDIERNEGVLTDAVACGRFLVIGAAGSVGQAVTKEIFKRSPKVLHVVDINENNMVELVRDIRSSLGYIEGDFRTFILDAGSLEFETLMNWSTGYDYVLNLSALKHVRSEKDPFTLMRMIDVNINNTIKSLELVINKKACKYFCVSTDKAAAPASMMGASKRIMEMHLIKYSRKLPISTARFANVAFSDGSLLHGFTQRVLKRQPVSAPCDIRRFFLTAVESGQLCLMSCVLGENLDIFFPKLDESSHAIRLSEIAAKFLRMHGYEPVECESEEEARNSTEELIADGRWPCYFFESDTTGEKEVEQFYTGAELLDLSRFEDIGVIKSASDFDGPSLDHFHSEISRLRASGSWSKEDLVALFKEIVPEFRHKETGRYLDERM